LISSCREKSWSSPKELRIPRIRLFRAASSRACRRALEELDDIDILSLKDSAG